jgi:hypothetical protein
MDPEIHPVAGGSLLQRLLANANALVGKKRGGDLADSLLQRLAAATVGAPAFREYLQRVQADLSQADWPGPRQKDYVWETLRCRQKGRGVSRIRYL